jgi:predicted porin
LCRWSKKAAEETRAPLIASTSSPRDGREKNSLKTNRIIGMVAAGLAAGFSIGAAAQDSKSVEIAELKTQAEALQHQSAALNQQIQGLQTRIDALSAPPAQTPAVTTKEAVDTSNIKIPHGFFERKVGNSVTFYVPGGELTTYANLDISLEASTKGLGGKLGPDGNPPVGNMGWLPALSTNLSFIGINGFQALGRLPFDFIYQLETQIDIATSSGVSETNSSESNVVKGGLTSRNSFLGLASKRWGRLMIGKTDAPYKNSTARFNPFFAMIGDYQVIMANTGGDNRVEFGTRLDHSIWYLSPVWKGLEASILVSPGQNRADNSDNIAAGESDCTGGNIPGSGGITPLTCSDGSFGTATSASLAYSKGALFITGAYERHEKVNRSSDITGIYASGNATSVLLQSQDVAAEDAGKIGAVYTFAGRTTVGGIFETLHRYVPADLEFQNERQRLGSWFFASQKLSRNTSAHFGWAHAFRAPGDPGQHNDSNAVPPGGDPVTDATAGAHVDNTANLFTLAFKEKLNRNLTAYMDWALTANGPAAHYDLGAGGRAITTDCHDASDATGGLVGSNPHCWTGGQLMGVSAGMNYKF